MDKDERSLVVLAVSVCTGLFAALLIGSLAVGGEPVFNPVENSPQR